MRDRVAHRPCREAILHLVIPELDVGTREVLGVRRLVQAMVHRNLHHDSCEHESFVNGGAARGQWPGA